MHFGEVCIKLNHIEDAHETAEKVWESVAGVLEPVEQVLAVQCVEAFGGVGQGGGLREEEGRVFPQELASLGSNLDSGAC